MTTTAPPPAPAATPKGSLARAEVRRLTSRRFIRLVLLLALVGYAVVVGISAATEFGKVSPERTAAAEREVEQIVEEQNRYYRECLDDANRPEDVPPEQFCGGPVTAEDIPVDQFLDKRPFELAEGLPSGSTAVAFATSAIAFLIGATFIGAEWSTRSIVALLFWEPRRLKVMAAKLGVLAAGAAVLAAAAQLLWLLTARVMAATLGTSEGLPSGFYGDVLAQQGRAVVLGALVALLGFGFANLIRNTGAALGVGFVYFAVVENVVRVVRPTWQQWLLSDNALALVQRGGHSVSYYDGSAIDPQSGSVGVLRVIELSNLHGALVLGIATAALVAAGVVLFVRRDLH